MSEHPIFWLAKHCQEWRFDGGWKVPVPKPQVYLVMGLSLEAAMVDVKARRFVNNTLRKIRKEVA